MISPYEHKGKGMKELDTVLGALLLASSFAAILAGCAGPQVPEGKAPPAVKAGNLKLDHVVILVNDLAKGMQGYTALGFTVTPGGEHKALGTHNALIPFEDGSYIELIAFKQRSVPVGTTIPKPTRHLQLFKAKKSPVERRFLAWETSGEGLVDFALVPSDIEAVIAAARAGGLTLEGPFPGNRTRPDGQEVAWKCGMPTTPDVPFLCADVTPRSLRVPEGPARQHANGVTGVKRLVVGVKDMKTSASRYKALLGADPQAGTSGRFPDVRTMDFALGSSFITLATPLDKSAPLNRRLLARGEGPCALILRTNNKVAQGWLDPAKTSGARIELAVE